MNKLLVLNLACVGVMFAAPSFADDKPAKPAEAKPAAKPADAKPAEAKPAAAEAPKMEGPPKPPEQVAAAAKAMAGTWKCAGTAAASPMGPEHKYEATMTMKMSPDKFWLVANYAEKKAKDHPMAYKFTEYRTFDTKSGKWVGAHMGEMGDLMTGSGTGDEKGEDWTWKSNTTPMMPGDFHLVSTTKSPKEVELKGEVVAADGTKPAFTATCKK